MRWPLLALCACNQVFGLSGGLVERDGTYFDAPADAQPYCPSFGVLPTFSPSFREIIDQQCYDYNASTTGIAIARCYVPSRRGLGLVQGPVDSVLTTPAVGIELTIGDTFLDNIHISPEGDAAYGERFDLTTTTTTVESYARTGEATWTRGPDITTSTLAGASTPSRGPDTHLLIFDRQLTQITEIVRSGASWNPVATFTLAMPPVYIWMSSDASRALALIGANDQRWVYLDRRAIGDPFTIHDPFTSLPPVRVFITEDCTRAYASSVDAVFYASQI